MSMSSATKRTVPSPLSLESAGAHGPASARADGSGPSIDGDFIKEDLRQFMGPKKKRSSYTIFRVREREKEVKPQHFRPELISLGLYDRSTRNWGTRTPKQKDESETPRQPIAKGDSNIAKSKGDAFRLEIVSALLKELGKTTAQWDEICNKVVEDKQKMRNLYEEHRDLLPMAAVSSALTLDAIFLVCCLGTCYNDEFASKFKLVFKVFMSKSNTFRKMLLLDIIKLENQIPLCLIQNTLQYLIDLKYIQVTRPTILRKVGLLGKKQQIRVDEEWGTDERSQSQLDANLILHSICSGLANHYSCCLPFTVPEKNDEKSPVFDNCKHLLDCLYTAMFVDSNKKPKEKDSEPKQKDNESKEDNEPKQYDGIGEQDEESSPSQIDEVGEDVNGSSRSHTDRMLTNMESNRRITRISTLDLSSIPENAHCGSEKGPENGAAETQEQPLVLDGQVALPSATQLHEAGIKCRAHSGHSGAFKEPEFKVYAFKAVLYLPVISYMKSHSEPLWRNLVAYEDEKCENDDTFASYLELMDQLIDTERDVGLLRMGTNPVIVAHGLGSEQAVAEVFNSILSNYDVDLKTYHHWNDLRLNIYKYINNENKQKFVKFARAYLNEPWLIVSILAGGALLILAFLQTYYTIR